MSKLFSFFRSSAAFRVRIALNLKHVDYECVPVHLRKDEHKQDGYREINPMAMVPFYVDDMVSVGQSLAIIEYLEERYPEPALLPNTFAARARVRSIAQSIACDMQPLTVLRVTQFLENEWNHSAEDLDQWMRHWMQSGFASLERVLASSTETGIYCHGDEPSLADIYLIPQVLNAQRINLDINQYPTISRITEACLKLDAFQKAMPENQPDAE